MGLPDKNEFASTVLVVYFQVDGADETLGERFGSTEMMINSVVVDSMHMYFMLMICSQKGSLAAQQKVLLKTMMTDIKTCEK